MTKRTGQGDRIPTLDGWRAVAIVGVLLSHSRHLLQPGGPFPAPRLNEVLATLRLGVDLFFAISGFLITTLLVRSEGESSRARLSSFYTRRVFRILPLVVTYLAVLSALAAVIPGVAKPWEIIGSLLFARNYLMHWPGGEATNHFWSLSVEEHFYLLWPPLLVFLGARRAALTAAIAAVAVAGWRALDARYAIFGGVFGADPGALFRTDTRLDALLWGAVAGIIAPTLRRLVPERSRFPLTALTLLALAVWNYRSLPLLSTALALLFPLLVVSTVLRPHCFASRFLDLAPLRWIGQRSYSLYIWQTLFLQVASLSFSLRAGPTPSRAVLSYLLDLALIVALSAASHRFIERPAQQYGRRLAATISSPPSARPEMAG